MELPQEIKSAGAHELSFNQKNLSSGIYFYTIQAKSVDGRQSYRDTKKMILLK